VDYPLGEFAMNTTAVDSENRAFEDFVAVPDLIAGTFADIATVWSRKAGWKSDGNLSLAPNEIPPKANMISTWFCSQHSLMRRCALLIDKHADDRFSVDHCDVIK